jgi:hypothetical protein
MGGAAQAKAMSEQARPVFTHPHITTPGESLPPQILCPFFPMSVMCVSPQPGRQRPVLLAHWFFSDNSLIDFRLGRKEPIKGGTGQLAGIPGMIRANLRIADTGVKRCGTPLLAGTLPGRRWSARSVKDSPVSFSTLCCMKSMNPSPV